ncbi:MAG TPA: hypothetical protein VJM33_05855 [Microthrixaceae bacterium]|nr:hypothetical protein [Microthrixaceae bacterium]
MLRRSTVLLLCVTGLVAASCGDDGEPTVRSSDPPDEIVAFAIATLGPERAVVPVAQGREVAIAAMAITGIPRSEAECVLTEGTRLLGGEEAVAKLTVGEMGRFGRQVEKVSSKPEEEILAECVSAESLQRQKAQQLAPDYDPALMRDTSAAVTLANALAVGLTPAEADCYWEQGYGSLTEEEMTASVEGEPTSEDRPTVDAVSECLSEERIGELAPKLEQDILDRQEERAKEEEEFRQRVNEELAATTTVP